MHTTASPPWSCGVTRPSFPRGQPWTPGLCSDGRGYFFDVFPILAHRCRRLVVIDIHAQTDRHSQGLK